MKLIKTNSHACESFAFKKCHKFQNNMNAMNFHGLVGPIRSMSSAATAVVMLAW
jgi:hypothetical protein